MKKLFTHPRVALITACCAALLPCGASAQVYATSPGGTGYVTTPSPVSPNCTAPNVWTAYNGHYICAPPPPQCQYGYASAPVLGGNGAWSYACNGPPAPPVVVTPPAGGGTTTNQSLLSICESAIQSRASSAGVPYSILPYVNGGWAVEGTYWSQPSAQSVLLTNDTNFSLYSNGGMDYAYTVYDSTEAGIMVWYQCVINPSSGAVNGVTSGAASGQCAGCGGSSGQ